MFKQTHEHYEVTWYFKGGRGGAKGCWTRDGESFNTTKQAKDWIKETLKDGVDDDVYAFRISRVVEVQEVIYKALVNKNPKSEE